VTSYFPGQESLVTVLRYRVVIDEIVVSAKKFAEYNQQALQSDEPISPDDFFETHGSKFQDWGWGSPCAMANCSEFVGEDGEGYVAFKGDVTSGSDDLFPGTYDSWAHCYGEPIPFACNDYFKRLGLSSD
jgi:hypothetical protein